MKETDNQFNVKYHTSKYDIQKFLENHPGGVNYLKPFKGKEVANRMLNTEHSKAAYYLLREYKVGGRDTEATHENADLEKLVNWDEPILFQVPRLGPKYSEWVSSPVDRQLRLFGNPVLEFLTTTPWYVVPIVWLPVALYCIYIGIKKYTLLNFDQPILMPAVMSIASGVLLWTLIEYSLHRWVFHLEPSGYSKVMIIVHFALHGLHHKVPFDTRRLVFPPFPAAVIGYTLFTILSGVIPESVIFLVFAGGILGYVCYDMIHFYLHYGAPKENSYLYHLKRYHNQHHFAHHESGFGISSVLWDKVFGTTITLRKLASGIQW